MKDLAHFAAQNTQPGAEQEVLVYAVSGTAGEYSDRSEWVAKVFEREADAQAFVERMDALGREWWAKFQGDRYSKCPIREAATAALRAVEPGWTDDYTGPAIYYVESVLFVRASSDAAPSQPGMEPLQGRNEQKPPATPEGKQP